MFIDYEYVYVDIDDVWASYMNNVMYEIMMMAREPIWTPEGAYDVYVYIIVHYDSGTC